MASLSRRNLVNGGWTQAAIASHLKIPQGTVCRDLVAMREFWRNFPVYDFEKLRFEQLQKIDLIEAEALCPGHACSTQPPTWTRISGP